jgi:predicted amino acid racemase
VIGIIKLDGTGQILFGREQVTLDVPDEKFRWEAESGTDAEWLSGPTAASCTARLLPSWIAHNAMVFGDWL